MKPYFLQVDDISYHYQEGHSAFKLKPQSLTLSKGQLLVILGPSGSGKSTLLQLLAGLLQPDTGTILMDGAPVHGLPPEKRGLSMIFQKPYLLPFLTVGENVEIGLKLQGIPRRDRRAKAEHMLQQMGLSDMYNRSISSLSGGQEQRVALARSLVIEPRLLLLDEPFSQLDPMLRRSMGRWLMDMKQQWDTPMIMITHDREEALTLGDHFLIMRDGAMQQWGTLEDVYYEPSNGWTAQFMGFDNVISGIKTGAQVHTCLGVRKLREGCAGISDGPVQVTLRSEWLALTEPGEHSAMTGRVIACSFQGEYSEVKVQMAEEMVVIKQLGIARLEPQSLVGVHIKNDAVWCLPREVS
ncbi:ABC transporter ATP-binding protein [Paenibacillus sp. PL2-23]|uniref:ABC transporter ATP-binding protein n=1 Tax=Paenibacillus sp. PL2-23 TaxID=2100729 RepID=UPI0030F63F56